MRMNEARPNNGYKTIGRRAARVEAFTKVAGRAVYADDVHLPGMLYGRLKRSTVAHGRILSIDTEHARALPGVRAVITGADLPVRYGILPVHQDETALAVDRVRYLGEPVAAVCADTEDIAQRALDLIDVSYSPLECVLSVEDAFAARVRLHESEKFSGNAHRVVALEFGDVAGTLAGCEYTREDMFYYAGSTHLPMETHATVADFTDGRLTLIVSHQAPYYLQRILPKVLGIPAHALRVVVPYVGGGFGGKLDPFPDTICAGKLSIITGRPVKFTLSREEVFYNHRGRHPSLMWIRSGWKQGEMAAVHFRAFLDGGAYGSFGTAAAYYHGALQGTTYRLGTYKAEIVRFYTNKPPCGPKRGHGTPQPRFALECHIDRVAEELGVPADELRRKNLIAPYSTTVNHLRVTSCGLDECIRRVVDASGYHDKRGHLPFGEGIGLAVGCYISGAALPIYWNEMPHSEVMVKADRSGKISAYSGHTEIGQGADTVLAWIVAEVLGIEPDEVTLVLRDSDSVPPDLGSYSSRVTMMMGNAARDAAEKLKQCLAESAASALSADVGEIIFDGRKLYAADRERFITLEDAIQRAEAAHGMLSFTGSYTPRPKYGDFKGAGVGPSPAYSYSACAIQVSVDTDTGRVQPVKVWIAHDIGKCISRINVEGQVEGGVYMGLGEALMEEMAFTPAGLLRNAGLLDYKSPTALDMPEIETFLVEDPDPEGPFGAKEVGQGPLLPVPPALVNAVYDAIGVRFDEIPVTPDKVLRALERRSERVGPRRVIEFPFPEPVKVEVPADAADRDV
ncbi:MAG TPA: molybdopterin cofactor-binding domain-containing protein [Candidatus Krumholzibacteria bacterium]|nr:molybdopterin cofactor-binding domain-containing protein [Candidatus Krumholzibacteria bacterium]